MDAADLACTTPLVAPAMTDDAATALAGALKAMLESRFGIAHATLELECHACAEDESGHV